MAELEAALPNLGSRWADALPPFTAGEQAPLSALLADVVSTVRAGVVAAAIAADWFGSRPSGEVTEGVSVAIARSQSSGEVQADALPHPHPHPHPRPHPRPHSRDRRPPLF